MLSKILILYLFCISYSLCSNPLEVKTSSGTVRGKAIEVTVFNKTVNQFLNIPFAEPPVGKLRFSKPIPLKEPKKDIIDGTKTGNSCHQNERQKTGILTDSEDCLVLNVWTPQTTNSSDLKPVMFWIYGGSFTSGSIFLPSYDGKLLATYDVVYVAVNYRLGPFGFLYGGDESAPGNLGLYDQLLALKWVKQNIHLFGGDPNQVTIFGESAGSYSVSAHVLSPLSRGLFKRAILQSGSILENKNMETLPKAQALKQARVMAHHFNCSDDNQWLDCLRRIDAKILNNYYDMKSHVLYETEFLPLIAQKAFKAQNYSTGIDIMAGVMQNEGSILAHLSFPKSEHLRSAEEFSAFVKSLPFPQLDSEKITEFYLKGVDINNTESLKKAFYDFYGDLHIKCSTYFFAKQFVGHSPKQNVIFYEWTQPSQLLGPIMGCTKDMGVCHASELEYVFGLTVLMNMSDKKFSEDVMKMWTNFAKNGNPLASFPDNYHWPRLIESGKASGVTKIKEINASKPNHIFEDLFTKVCDGFWNNYFN